MQMKTALTVLAAAAAVFAQGAFAQASAPANPPAGQGPGAMTAAPGTKSETTRAERKSATVEARKDGDLKPAGPATGAKEQMAEQKKPSTKTRAERKAETVEDVKDGKTIPAGEGPTAPKK